MIEQETLKLAHQGDVEAMIKTTEYFFNEKHNEEAALKWADRLSATLNIQALSEAVTVYRVIGEVNLRISQCTEFQQPYYLYNKALTVMDRIEKLNASYAQKDTLLKLIAELYVMHMHSNYEQALVYLYPLREKGSPFAAYMMLECHKEMGKQELLDEDNQILNTLIEEPDRWPNMAIKATVYNALTQYYAGFTTNNVDESKINVKAFCKYAQRMAEAMSEFADKEDDMYKVFYKTKYYLIEYGLVKQGYNYYKQEINKRTSLSTGEWIVIIIGFLWWIIPGIIALVCFQNKAKDNRNKYPVTDEDIRTMKACMDSLQQSALNTGILQYLPQNVITPEQFPGIYEQYEREYHWS